MGGLFSFDHHHTNKLANKTKNKTKMGDIELLQDIDLSVDIDMEGMDVSQLGPPPSPLIFSDLDEDDGGDMEQVTPAEATIPPPPPPILHMSDTGTPETDADFDLFGDDLNDLLDSNDIYTNDVTFEELMEETIDPEQSPHHEKVAAAYIIALRAYLGESFQCFVENINIVLNAKDREPVKICVGQNTNKAHAAKSLMYLAWWLYDETKVNDDTPVIPEMGMYLRRACRMKFTDFVVLRKRMNCSLDDLLPGELETLNFVVEFLNLPAIVDRLYCANLFVQMTRLIIGNSGYRTAIIRHLGYVSNEIELFVKQDALTLESMLMVLNLSRAADFRVYVDIYGPRFHSDSIEDLKDQPLTKQNAEKTFCVALASLFGYAEKSRLRPRNYLKQMKVSDLGKKLHKYQRPQESIDKAKKKLQKQITTGRQVRAMALDLMNEVNLQYHGDSYNEMSLRMMNDTNYMQRYTKIMNIIGVSHVITDRQMFLRLRLISENIYYTHIIGHKWKSASKKCMATLKTALAQQPLTYTDISATLDGDDNIILD